MPIEKKISLLLKSLFGLSLFYTIFSYSLTDPNLVLSTWPPYWQFQQWMWQTFFHNRELLVASYTLLIAGFFGIYFAGLRSFQSAKLEKKSQPLNLQKLFLSYLIALSPLLFSYNALSHDVFNYIFNAKMVAVFHANPHVQVALDFSHDNWTRFMHNTHTPAPYGYGWTALSLIPYSLGLNKFLITWLLFRGFSVVSLMLLYKVLQKISLQVTQKELSLYSFWLIFGNPLLFIEIISNQHNDLWMMVPALGALLLLLKKSKRFTWSQVVFSGALLAFSAMIKFATIVLMFVWLATLSRWFSPKLQKIFSWQAVSLLSSILLFLPLFTLRSQQFLPWYLVWSLVWLPFIKPAWWKYWLLAFSFTAMLRYIPWLWAGEFTETVLIEQKWLVWGGGIGAWLIAQLWLLSRRVGYNSSR